MPYPVEHLIEGRGLPVWVKKDETVTYALSVMIEHDYSQLPVVDAELRPLGMVTQEGILRGVRNFNARLNDLRVRDVMSDAPIYNLEDDLFDLLDRLKLTNAVLIVNPANSLVGIVTSYDSTEYFRKRTEDLMRVEDVESIIKDLVRGAYANEDGEPDDKKLADAVVRVISHVPNKGETNKSRSFDDLSLGEYISLLLMKETWDFFAPFFGVTREMLLELLENVRKTRNILAHFKGEITPEQRDGLRYCSQWLSRCQEDYQEKIRNEFIDKVTTEAEKAGGMDKEVFAGDSTTSAVTVTGSSSVQAQTSDSAQLIPVEEQAGPKDSRYTPLADYLQSQPGSVDRVQLTFDQIEAIIDGELPASARNHRAWWSNDATPYRQSNSWLDIGWRTTYINMSEGKITFARIREREKAYIEFFSRLLVELRKKSNLRVRELSPDGASWMFINGIPEPGPQYAAFGFSFSRNNRMRVEMFIDAYDQEKTKRIFDALYSQRAEFEVKVGSISWERIDKKRGSRIALYHPGAITDDPKKLGDLRHWAVETMVKFQQAFKERASRVVQEVMAT